MARMALSHEANLMIPYRHKTSTGRVLFSYGTDEAHARENVSDYLEPREAILWTVPAEEAAA